MHATPVAGHMAEYKTLYRIRLRFFWPRMRTDIKERIHKCPHYTLTYRWRRHGQELFFLARQFSFCYPSCGLMDAKSSYR